MSSLLSWVCSKYFINVFCSSQISGFPIFLRLEFIIIIDFFCVIFMVSLVYYRLFCAIFMITLMDIQNFIQILSLSILKGNFPVSSTLPENTHYFMTFLFTNFLKSFSCKMCFSQISTKVESIKSHRNLLQHKITIFTARVR